MKTRLLNPYELDITTFEKGKRINKGGFGVVYKAKNIETGEVYAAKVIDCGDDSKECAKFIRREIELMANLKHPTIVRLIGYSTFDFQNESNATLIMELASKGSLQDIITNIYEKSSTPRNYTNTTRQIILIGIARGVKYLHDRNVIHRDLKLANILLNDKFFPLITDFGLSKFFEVGHTYTQSQFGGTLPYMAPELFQDDKYGPEVDVYAFGILMFEIITNKIAYADYKKNPLKFQNEVVNYNFRPMSDDDRSQIKPLHLELIENCWAADPSARPTFQTIFKKLCSEQYFLDDVDFNEVQSYIKEITVINDPFEQLLAKCEYLEEQNAKLVQQNHELSQQIHHLLQSKKHKSEPVISRPTHSTSKIQINRKPLKIFKTTNEIISKKPNKIDFLIIVDITKSTEDSIIELLEYLVQFINTFFDTFRRFNSACSLICYNTLGDLFSFDFCNEPQQLTDFFEETIQPEIENIPYQKRSQPCDFISIAKQISKHNWRSESKKCVYWIASNPARGPTFCGETGNESDEQELIQLLKELFKHRMLFAAYSTKEAKTTFDAIKSFSKKKLYASAKFSYDIIPEDFDSYVDPNIS